MELFETLISKYAGTLCLKYGFSVRRGSFSNGQDVVLFNDCLEILFQRDKRVNIVACVFGLAEHNRKAGFQYSVEKLVDFEGGHSLHLFEGDPASYDLSNQIEIYVSALENFGNKLLSGDTRRFELLHEFSRGYNAAYTQCMS